MNFSMNNVNGESKERLALFAGLIVLSLMMLAMAHAGTDATFDAWVDNMDSWLKGSLGKGISIGFVVIGIIAGMMRQSLMAFVVGVGAALGLNYTPSVIDAMFTAIL